MAVTGPGEPGFVWQVGLGAWAACMCVLTVGRRLADHLVPDHIQDAVPMHAVSNVASITLVQDSSLTVVCPPCQQRDTRMTMAAFCTIFTLVYNVGGGACGFLAVLQAVRCGALALVRRWMTVLRGI